MPAFWIVQICVCITQAVLLYVQFPWCNESIMYCWFSQDGLLPDCAKVPQRTLTSNSHTFSCAFSQQITFTTNLEKIVSIWLFAVHPLPHDKARPWECDIRWAKNAHFCIWQILLTKATSFNMYLKSQCIPWESNHEDSVASAMHTFI